MSKGSSAILMEARAKHLPCTGSQILHACMMCPEIKLRTKSPRAEKCSRPVMPEQHCAQVTMWPAELCMTAR